MGATTYKRRPNLTAALLARREDIIRRGQHTYEAALYHVGGDVRRVVCADWADANSQAYAMAWGSFGAIAYAFEYAEHNGTRVCVRYVPYCVEVLS